MYDELIKWLREEAKFPYNDNRDLFAKAADAIEELEKQLDEETEYATALACNVPRWIPVTERLPKDRQRVLAISLSKISPRRSCYRLVYFSNNLESVDNLEFEGESRCGFYYYDSEYGFCEVDDVTHWMTLPEPPKAKEGE